MELFVAQLLNGLVYGVLLFLMAAGLSLIFGVTRTINMAHGSLYMLGAYVAVTLATSVGGALGFWGGIVASALIVGLIGAAIEIVAARIPTVVIGHHQPDAQAFDTVNDNDRLGAIVARHDREEIKLNRNSPQERIHDHRCTLHPALLRVGPGILQTHAGRHVEHDQNMAPVFVCDGFGDVDLGW